MHWYRALTFLSRCVIGVSVKPGKPIVLQLRKHRDVWADNVDAEFAVIREAIVNYPYVAMVRRSPPRPGARDSFAANSAPSTHRHTGTPPSCFPRSSPRVCRQDTEFPGVVRFAINFRVHFTSP